MDYLSLFRQAVLHFKEHNLPLLQQSLSMLSPEKQKCIRDILHSQ